MEFKFAKSSYRIVDSKSPVGKPWMVHFLIERKTDGMPQAFYIFNKKPMNRKEKRPSAKRVYDLMEWMDPESYHTSLVYAREAFRSALKDKKDYGDGPINIDNIEPGERGQIEKLFDSKPDDDQPFLPFLGPKNASTENGEKSTWTQDQVYADGDNVYDVGLLIEQTKNNFEKKVRVREYKHLLFDRDVWGTKDHPLSPMDVINNPTFNKDNVKHMQGIRTADLSKPVLIRLKNNLIIDGYHRLARAFLQGDEWINAKFVAEEQMGRSIFK